MAAALNPPRHELASPGEQPLAIPEPPPHRPGVAPEPVSILLVDDDERSLRTLRHVLEPLGQKLVQARSGEQALRWLLREEFAVILLDMRMPGLDGLQTARYINARARTRHIPIVFLTAQSEDVDRVFGAHAAGAVDYVAKPFDPDVLRSKVSVFVELHQARAEHIYEAHARAEAEGVASTIGKLQAISDAALAHLELDEMLPEILRRASAVFGADAAGLLLIDDPESPALTLLTEDGVAQLAQADALRPLAELLADALSGVPMSLQEPLSADLAALPEPLRSRRLASLIAAPLTVNRRPLGTLFLGSEAPRRFSEEDVVVLALGAERAAIALEHARSYERERGLVGMLQDHLLPDRLPRTPGLAMAARYRPGERLAQVGGDWYDAILLPNGDIGLVIGDVVGHGIAAATLMAEMRATLRAYALAEPGSPAAAVASLNKLVAATHRRMVATLLYVVVDADGSSVRFTSAGHLPPLLVSEDGEPTFLSAAAAAPLGVAPHTRYQDARAPLRPGATLLLYTDGLIERRGEVIDTGLQRLLCALRDAPADIDGMCAHILAAADDGGGLQDDTALVAVRRLAGTSELLDVTLPAEPQSVPGARHRLSSWLSAHGVDDAASFDIVLAANEALTNAVEHAYGPEGGCTFRLLAESSPGAITVRVSDSGNWRAPRGAARGRGLRVIADVMDELDVRRGTKGTTIDMVKSRSSE